MGQDRNNALALLLKNGKATDTEAEEIVQTTYAAIRAVGKEGVAERLLPRCDYDDFVQDAIIRCLNRLPEWDPARCAWLTFSLIIAFQEMVAQWRRRQAYGKITEKS